MADKKINEVIILSYCEKEYKVGLEVYKEYTQDEYFKDKKKEDLDEYDPRTVHPTKEMQIGSGTFKIHFFDIQDRYWPAISNICKHCDGAVIVIDLDDYTLEGGEEFVNEWLVNLDDLDKDDMPKIIIGVNKSNESTKNNEGWNKIVEITNDKKIECREVSLKKNELESAFKYVYEKINQDGANNNIKKEDEDIDIVLKKYELF